MGNVQSLEGHLLHRFGNASGETLTISTKGSAIYSAATYRRASLDIFHQNLHAHSNIVNAAAPLRQTPLLSQQARVMVSFFRTALHLPLSFGVPFICEKGVGGSAWEAVQLLGPRSLAWRWLLFQLMGPFRLDAPGLGKKKVPGIGVLGCRYARVRGGWRSAVGSSDGLIGIVRARCIGS